jgi:hypothetical protein
LEIKCKEPETIIAAFFSLTFIEINSPSLSLTIDVRVPYIEIAESYKAYIPG